MSIEAGTARGWAAALVPALAVVLAGTGAVAAGAATGGYHQGGNHSWASYSACFSTSVRKLFLQAGGR